MSKLFRAFLRRPAPAHWPLQVKLLLSFASAQLLLCALLLTAVVSRTDSAVYDTVLALASQLESHARAVLVEPILQEDTAQVQVRVSEMAASLSAKAIEVYDLNNKLVAHAGNTEVFNTALDIRHSDKIQWDTDQTVMVSSLVEFDKEKLGRVRMAIDLGKFTQARSELLNQFNIIAFLATCLAIAVGAVLSGAIIRRVKRLTQISDRIIEGDYSAKVVDNNHDELGRLGHGLNVLSQTVNDRVSQLLASQQLQLVYLTESRGERARLQALLDSMNLGIVFIDHQGEPIYINRYAQVIWANGLPQLSNVSQDIPERELTLADGRLVRESCRRVFDDDIKLGCVWLFEDITAEKQAQQTIRFLAQRDELTGLYNRRSLNESLGDSITSAPLQPLALVYVDLDNFKFINDLSGHEHGDTLLREFAAKITSVTRSSDVVARMGGDEFLILIKDMSQSDLSQWCDRLLALLGLNELTCSIGVACYPRDGNSVSGLVAASYQAMLDAKRAGKNAWRQYHHKADLAKQRLETMLWSDRINQALRFDGFEVFLQGVHHTDDCSIHHYEALIRLPDQTRDKSSPAKYFSPGEFIAHAESSGKIVDIDRWMIAKVVGILALEPKLPPIAVNVSGVTLSEVDLPDYVRKLLEQNRVAAKRLHLELTETTALSDIKTAQAHVRALQTLGCSVALDDFGSGFASLAYLKHIDADYLKVDGQFIQNLHKDRENQILLRAIVDIAQNASRLTVAEWVESEEILQLVRDFKVELAQGYHLSKPTPASTIIAKLHEDEITSSVVLS
jgi:diguanylate cyclase (GGDEF)-like protein